MHRSLCKVRLSQSELRQHLVQKAATKLVVQTLHGGEAVPVPQASVVTLAVTGVSIHRDPTLPAQLLDLVDKFTGLHALDYRTNMYDNEVKVDHKRAIDRARRGRR